MFKIVQVLSTLLELVHTELSLNLIATLQVGNEISRPGPRYLSYKKKKEKSIFSLTTIMFIRDFMLA
ncbi:hypothetical protein RHMOL_Rhmol03G0285400 [Rhododendron molle]|uniref:Uncharacterized protein n=1 Tax=Rhododendron molle TaxID=49168 RepID=A0ACC0PJ42_RHOML|nr:hypothetical protein RHMOL_Rhmol03G0285400 [Rhododendron molle]